MNRVLLFVILSIFGKLAGAQEHFVKGSGSDLYLVHKVTPKETWYSIARSFNITPRELAAYNKVNINKTLEIGDELKVPLNSTNFTQNDTRNPDETLVPVYHIVQEREWMYRISVNHNKVPIERLEKWNSISRDEAKAGMKLIVGHLRVKNGTNPVASGTSTTPVSQENPKTETKTTQATQPVQNTNQTGVIATTHSPATPGNGGFFRSQFAGGGKINSGVAGIFKSTSGWNDGKYYALINNVTVGTIVKITFPQTGKSIYAKVLGELPDMKESAGLALRISDAAANELGAGNSKFSVEIDRP